jgi:SAM-dependent methyltransferase
MGKMRWITTPYHIYVKHRDEKARIFCKRFPGGIDFTEKSVLDVGCGHGSLSLYAALNGAKSVCGIDIDERRIEIAKNRLAREFSQYSSLVNFVWEDVRDLKIGDFDIILSQAAFEHILEPKDVLASMSEKLSPGGKIYIGFGPLWNAPWGDHHRTEVPFQTVFPWAHLMFSEPWIVKKLNKKYPEQPISSIAELGLNRYSLKQYMEMFASVDLNLRFCKVNHTENAFRHLLNILRHLPGLKEYLSVNLFCILG